MRLTTAELLKNYFFNRENEQAFKECWEDVFEPTAEKREYWEQEIVTGRIKRTLVDLFFDAFLQILVQDKRRGVTTEDKLFYSRTSNLFQSYKDFIGRYCNGDKVEILDNMKAYAEAFESTFDPGYCDADIPLRFRRRAPERADIRPQELDAHPVRALRSKDRGVFERGI